MDQHAAHNRPMIVVVMGVSGAGKTTAASLSAGTWGGHFRRAMLGIHHKHGKDERRLADADRIPWLQRLADTNDDRRG